MLSNNCSILLIDDDADVLDAYTQLLEQAGYHVSACNNPFDAREQVPKDWPGIVLSDVCMPGCSGIDLMRALAGVSSQAINGPSACRPNWCR